MSSTATNPYPNLSAPAGAVFVSEWEDITTDDPYRFVQGPRAIIDTDRSGDVVVWWGGLQRPDGTVTYEVCVSQLHPDKPLTVAEARQVARAVMNAADAAERWSVSD